MKYDVVIGLEVHAQLTTETKIFCSCSSSFGKEQNSHGCPVCLGMPGTLPVPNRKVIEYAVRMGLAVNCSINKESIFARKNYFYPDLPKGYQISQYELPICGEGYIMINEGGKERKIGITRIHMEEDAGKLIHDRGANSLFDVNRCGVPLIEIVSEPDIKTPGEARLYLSSLRRILQYLEICDGNMEEGSFRCDANISLKPVGSEKLGTKTELKNMNSMSGVQKALEYEIERQSDLLDSGRKIVQQTLLWDENEGMAHPMRTKEEAHDYRYFPDPDLAPVRIDEQFVENVRNSMPELPGERKKRLIDENGLPEYDAEILTSSKPLADFFEKGLSECGDAKQMSNWMMGEVLRVMKDDGIDDPFALKITPSGIATLIKLVKSGKISGKIAKEVFRDMRDSGGNPEQIVEKKG
ncbi:MAG: Asp-tRNA(Asn)/Glu-tRNA(Gln) amidotransferase subunit GatB, partial [Fibrobacterota bacterium]